MEKKDSPLGFINLASVHLGLFGLFWSHQEYYVFKQKFRTPQIPIVFLERKTVANRTQSVFGQKRGIEGGNGGRHQSRDVGAWCAAGHQSCNCLQSNGSSQERQCFFKCVFHSITFDE